MGDWRWWGSPNDERALRVQANCVRGTDERQFAAKPPKPHTYWIDQHSEVALTHFSWPPPPARGCADYRKTALVASGREVLGFQAQAPSRPYYVESRRAAVNADPELKSQSPWHVEWYITPSGTPQPWVKGGK